MPEAFRVRTLCLSPDSVVDDGLLVTHQGRILASGPYRALAQGLPCAVRDLGERVMVPGLCNAHTHLELSHCQGLPRLGQGFLPWLQDLLAADLGRLPPAAVHAAVAQLAACGTAHVVDICSRNPRPVLEALRQAGVGATLCGELIGYAPLPPEALPLPQCFLELPPEELSRVAAAGHALYTTSPERLQRSRAWSQGQGQPFCLHLAELPEEQALLERDAGPLAPLLRKRLLPKDWQAPGLRPVAHAQALGLLGPGTLAVHCVHLDAGDRRMLRESGTTVCLCPRSNAAIGVGQADARALLEAGIPCCLGTDSLASNQDLDLWQELLALLEQVPLKLGAAVALTSAHAARLPGLGHLGSLQRGRRAAWTLLPPEVEAALCRG